MNVLRIKVRLLDGVALFMLALALVISVRTAHRVWRAPSAPDAAVPADVSVAQGLWIEAASSGQGRGHLLAADTMVVWVDYTCPVSAWLDRQIHRVMETDSTGLFVRFRHWPLGHNPSSWLAALSSACASDQGAFPHYHSALFEASILGHGVDEFLELANSKGVPDIAEFSRCVIEGTHASRIARDIELARAVEGRGTPTVLFNGIHLGSTPDSTALWMRMR